MADNILYYPHISVTDSTWLVQTLLYWDRIASIMPYDQATPKRLQPLTAKLMNERLLVPIHPEDYVGKSYQLVKEFGSFLERDPATQGYQHAFARMVQASEKQADTGQLPLLHHSKVGYELGHILVEKGLARRASNRWYQVEPHTAFNFMTFLAATLSCHPELRSHDGTLLYTPGTDATISLQRTSNIAERFGLRESIRRVVLKDILPTPSNRIDIFQLRGFREEYGQQLRVFRNEVEAFVLQVSEEKDEVSRQERIGHFKAMKSDEITNLREQMLLKGWIVKGGTVAAVVAATVQVVEKLQQHDLGYGALYSLGLLGAMSSAYALLQQRGISHAPMAYAALLERRLAKTQ
jgi:hypothetical protein